MSEKLTVEEALLRAEQIDRNFDAFDETAPKAVAAMGSRLPMSEALTGPMRSTPHRKAVEATAVPRTTVLNIASTTSGVQVMWKRHTRPTRPTHAPAIRRPYATTTSTP